MPRRSILSAVECDSLLALPETQDELIRHYTFSEADLSIIRQRRGNHNRLGFAVQLCYLRYPGFVLPTDAVPPRLCWQWLDGSCVSNRTSGRSMPSGRKPVASIWWNCRHG